MNYPVWALLLLSLGSCGTQAAQNNDGIGGTGLSIPRGEEEDGIGGTGRTAERPDLPDRPELMRPELPERPEMDDLGSATDEATAEVETPPEPQGGH